MNKDVVIKEVPFKPRVNLAKLKGQQFFNSLCLEFPPVEPFYIIKKMGYDFLIDDLEGEEGYTLYHPKKNKYKICIDGFSYKPRMYFTAMHELAHIQLNHFVDFDFYNITSQEEKILDHEADIFASQVLMPKIWIQKCNLHSLYDLAKYFRVSTKAIETRLKFLNMEYILENQPIKTKEENLLEIQRLVNEFRKNTTKF